MLLFIHAAVFAILCATALHINEPYLFHGTDGQFQRILARQQFVWGARGIGLDNNFLQSLGNAWFPVHSLAIPSYLAGALVGGDLLDPVATYVVAALELFAVTLTIARHAGLGYGRALVSAWLLPMLGFPVAGGSVLYPIMMLAPYVTSVIVVSGMIVLAFSNLGRHTLKHSAVSVSAIVALIIYMAIAFPAMSALTVPFVALVSVVLVLSSSRAELAMKVAGGFVILALLVASGTTAFLYGLYEYSAVHFFPGELANNRMDQQFVSTYFANRGSQLLIICAAVGGVLFAFWGPAFGRSLARAFLLAAACILGVGFLTTKYDFWRGPAPVYIEFCLWPFYAVYTVGLIGAGLSMMAQRAAGLRASRVLRASANPHSLLLLIVLLCSLWLVARNVGAPAVPDPGIVIPPVKTDIVALLERDIALAPAQQFRGRVANFRGGSMTGKVSWLELYERDFETARKTGNDHRLIGLAYHDIPMLEEYSPLITPAYFRFATAFFGLPGDVQMRNIVTHRRVTERLLTAIGVRFVITDSPITSGTLKATVSIGGAETLYLYEFASANVGQYSPTKAVMAMKPLDALALVGREDFDPAETIVSDASLSDALVPATDASLVVEKGGLQVRARSRGVSVILLPLEFSRCLILSPNSGVDVQPRLFRANFLQTGIEFRGELNASLRYHTGPFRNSKCRSTDADDFARSFAPRAVPFTPG